MQQRTADSPGLKAKLPVAIARRQKKAEEAAQHKIEANIMRHTRSVLGLLPCNSFQELEKKAKKAAAEEEGLVAVGLMQFICLEPLQLEGCCTCGILQQQQRVGIRYKSRQTVARLFVRTSTA